MPRFVLDNFGKGLDSTRNPTILPVGYARLSQNMLHNRGANRAELRTGIDRTTYLRTAAVPIYGLYEYINNAGTTTKLCQTNGVLQSWTAGLATAKTTVDAGHQSTAIPRFAQFLNFWLEADARDANYIGNGTIGYPLQIAAPSVVFTATPGAGSTSLAAGTYYYDYARYSSITSEISPAYGTAVSSGAITAGQQIVLNAASDIGTTEQFDRIKIYRTKVNSTGPYYEHPTHSAVTTANFDSGITDTTADASLTVLSTIHTSAGASKTDKPVGATDVVVHRGKVFLIGMASNRSRMRWCQTNALSFDSTTDARHDVDADDGDFLWRGFSVGGAVVLMKEHSIHLMNGDVNELSFTWQVESGKDAGIGCYCPYTATLTPIGIIFQGECGVYLYRPGSTPERISDTIQETLEGLDYAYKNSFVGGYDPCTRAYLLSVTPSGATTNTETYAYAIDTGAWSKWVYGMGKIKPSSWALMHNGSSRIKAYFGDSNGYIYETDTAGGNDGVTSGTETGTVTGGSSTTLEDTAAAFDTSGDGLRGIPATNQTATTTYETQEISSNTATVLTTETWTTNPSDDTYFVGAIEGILSFGRLDFGNAGLKRIVKITWEFQAQSSATLLIVGYTVDGDSEPTTVTTTTQVSTFKFTHFVNRHCVGISPYVRIVGTDVALEILRIEIDYVDLGQRV